MFKGNLRVTTRGSLTAGREKWINPRRQGLGEECFYIIGGGSITRRSGVEGEHSRGHRSSKEDLGKGAKEETKRMLSNADRTMKTEYPVISK